MLHFIAAHKIAAVITSVVIAGGIGGAAAKQSSDAAHTKQVHHALVVKQQKAAAAKTAAAQKAAAQKQATQQAQQAQQAMAGIAKTELESMILKDAQQKVSDGVLDGPVGKVDCQAAPTTATDPNQATFSCLAVTSTSSDGTQQGYGYVGTANYQTGEITAHLGNS